MSSNIAAVYFIVYFYSHITFPLLLALSQSLFRPSFSLSLYFPPSSSPSLSFFISSSYHVLCAPICGRVSGSNQETGSTGNAELLVRAFDDRKYKLELGWAGLGWARLG